MRTVRLGLLGFALALTAAQSGAGETVSDPGLGLRLTVPDGFSQDPTLVRGDIVYAFRRPPAAGREVGAIILVSRLRGVLGRERLDPKEVAAKAPGSTVSAGTWKGFDIDVFRVPEEFEGGRTVTLNAQVPLAPEAVQVGVVGDEADEEELRGVLRSVLDSLDGRTNWLDRNQRVGRAAEGGATLAMVCVGVMLLVVLVRKARTPSAKRPGA